MQSISTTTKSPVLQREIRLAFESTIYEAFEARKSIQEVHQERIRGIMPALHTLENTCSYCFLRTPSCNLSCNHRLCSYCVSAYGSFMEPGIYHVRRCPSCDSTTINKQPLSIMPSTAGSRALHLAGSNSEMLFRFLKDMEQSISLPNLPLRKFFDVVIASDRGK